MATSQILTRTEQAAAKKKSDQTPAPESKTTAQPENEFQKIQKEDQENEDCFTKWREYVCGMSILGNVCCECCCMPCMCASAAEFKVMKCLNGLFKKKSSAQPTESVEMQPVGPAVQSMPR